jgi:hypothetical protein
VPGLTTVEQYVPVVAVQDLQEGSSANAAIGAIPIEALASISATHKFGE